MTNKNYSHILDEVAGDQVPQDLNLAPNILNRIQKQKRNPMQLRTRFVFIILLLMIVMVAMIGTVPGVAAAIERWFGYVPGVGLVREGDIRVLAGPVSVTREGVTVTVEQVVIDSERTSLVYSVESIPDKAIVTGLDQHCPYFVSLRLPDGNELKASPNGLQYWGTGYQHRFNYSPLPAAINDAVLAISCLYQTRPGAAPENWEIPLHFVPSSSEVTAYPVIEIPTVTTSPPAITATPEQAVTVITSPQAGVIRLTLDRAVQMEDGYLIYATLHWEDTPYAVVEVMNLTETLHLTTSNGQEITFEDYYDEQTGVNIDQRQTIFAIKTSPLQTTDTLTLALDWVSVNLPVSVDFVFDPGANPQPGQTWALNQDVQVGEYSLRVRSATVEYGGYNFEMISDDGIINATLGDMKHPVVSGGGGGGNGDPGEAFFYSINYDGGLPDGPITVTIGSIAVKSDQHLRAEWTPPAASTAQLPTRASACLTADLWKTAIAQKPALPVALSGRVLTSQYLENPTKYLLTISNLDGSNPKVIEDAENGAFSPDGTKLAYSHPGGSISILDLETGENLALPGIGNNDHHPVWTPDGRQIVFNRGMDLFITRLDGTDMHSLTSGGLQEWPVGWLADRRLLYLVPGRENEYTIYALDIDTGASEVFSNQNIQSISPDGQYMLTIERDFGVRWLTYASKLDGSNRWLVADSSLWVLTPTWSPDGEWLLAGVSDSDAGSTIGALIHLSTCEVIPLPELKGNIYGWEK